MINVLNSHLGGAQNLYGGFNMNLKNTLKAKLKKSKGFTLIEMLIVVAIIAILVAVSIPMVSGSLNKAKINTDLANQRAAKAAAVITYMTDGESGNYYYDASAGKLIPEGGEVNNIKGYSQSRNTNKLIIKVKISDSGDVEIKWVEKGNTGNELNPVEPN